MNTPSSPTRWSLSALIAEPQGEPLDAYLVQLQGSVSGLEVTRANLTPDLAETEILKIRDRLSRTHLTGLLRSAGVDQAPLRELRPSPAEVGQCACVA